ALHLPLARPGALLLRGLQPSAPDPAEGGDDARQALRPDAVQRLRPGAGHAPAGVAREGGDGAVRAVADDAGGGELTQRTAGGGAAGIARFRPLHDAALRHDSACHASAATPVASMIRPITTP